MPSATPTGPVREKNTAMITVAFALKFACTTAWKMTISHGVCYGRTFDSEGLKRLHQQLFC
ncbi:hypothetical protein DsansV1_C04g0045621 [Dioscorea sansibarensis]